MRVKQIKLSIIYAVTLTSYYKYKPTLCIVNYDDLYCLLFTPKSL